MVAAHPLRGARRFLRLLLLLAFPLAAWGHPFHSSYAELERSASGALNVSLQVIPEDLERALSLQAQAPVVLVDTPALRALLTDYLAEHFSLSSGGTPRVLGLELDYRETWIYFTLPAPGAQATLRNTVLFDVETTQSNRVRCLWAPTAPALVFNREEPQQALAVYDATDPKAASPRVEPGMPASPAP